MYELGKFKGTPSKNRGKQVLERCLFKLPQKLDVCVFMHIEKCQILEEKLT